VPEGKSQFVGDETPLRAQPMSLAERVEQLQGLDDIHLPVRERAGRVSGEGTGWSLHRSGLNVNRPCLLMRLHWLRFHHRAHEQDSPRLPFDNQKEKRAVHVEDDLFFLNRASG
jgi:hypothetical protein